MNAIDSVLNRITQYRLVLYGLIVIVAAAFILSATGTLSYSLLALTQSLAVLLASGLVFHYLLRALFKSATSVESWIITALILFLILRPAENVSGLATLSLGMAIATASKYVLAFANRHIFNPAAIALVTLGLLGSGDVFWWVATDTLLPVVALVGFLIVRKVRRIEMVLIFSGVALISLAGQLGFEELYRNAIASGPLIFFAAVMLTEPATTPSRRWSRVAYATIVGVGYGAQYQFGPLHSTPELALVIGNVFAYAVSSRRRYQFKLTAHRPLGGGIHEFAFQPDHAVAFMPGQYLEWTLPHSRPDSRGNRRYFTVASAPGEAEVKLGVRIDPGHSSTFKKALLNLKPGTTVWASQLGGDFTLPDDQRQPLVFIAGGVGITPFRSMVQHLIDLGEHRDINLFYTSVAADGFAYWELFNSAAKVGLKSHYVITGQEIPEGWTGLSGFLTTEVIKQKVPHIDRPIYFLSGPNAMVTNYKKMLLAAGVPYSHIKTDYFPGF
jgi:ferredoxin-NADP reductase